MSRHGSVYAAWLAVMLQSSSLQAHKPLCIVLQSRFMFSYTEVCKQESLGKGPSNKDLAHKERKWLSSGLASHAATSS